MIKFFNKSEDERFIEYSKRIEELYDFNLKLLDGLKEKDKDIEKINGQLEIAKNILKETNEIFKNKPELFGLEEQNKIESTKLDEFVSKINNK